MKQNLVIDMHKITANTSQTGVIYYSVRISERPSNKYFL